MEDCIICPKHGKQGAIGNYEECEACLIEYKEKHIEYKIEEERRQTWSKRAFEELYGKNSYKKVLDTAKTGRI